MAVATAGILVLTVLRPTQVAAIEPIKIGAVLPFSGGVELYGQQAKLGLELAAADINAAGGILGRPVEMVFRDDGTRPQIAAEAARKVVEEDGALAVVGPITSQNLDAIVPVLASHRTPLLYATNYEGGQCSRYMFALNTVPNQELDSLLPYMTKTFGSDYFLIGADRDWPHRMFEAAEPLIARLGGKVAGKQYTLGTAKDFPLLADQLANSKAKVLLYALKGDGMGFIPYASDRGLFKNTTVAFLGLTEADLKAFGGRVDNIYAAVPFVVDQRGSEGQGFCHAGARQGRAGHGSLELRRDPLQRAACREGSAREGRQSRQGGAGRRARRGDVQLTRWAGHDRQGPSRYDRHVPRADRGTAAGAGPGARCDRPEVRLHTGSGRALIPWRVSSARKGRPEAALFRFRG